MYKFALQPVLEHRERIQEARLRAYDEILAQATALQDEKERLVEKIGENIQALSDMLRQPTERARIQPIENWIAWASAEEDRLKAEIEKKRGRVQQRRRELASAVRDKRVLEELRARDRKEYMREMDRDEQRFFDDFAVRQYDARKREEKRSLQGERIAR